MNRALLTGSSARDFMGTTPPFNKSAYFFDLQLITACSFQKMYSIMMQFR